MIRSRSLVRDALGHAREAIEVGAAVVRYRRAFVDQVRPVRGRPTWQTRPVVLVHGFGHNAGAWTKLATRLAAAGFFDLAPVTYGVDDDIPTIAARIGEAVDALTASHTPDRVHLVGHSLGGVAIRYWHDVLGGDAHADAIVTLGAPLQGTAWTHLPFLRASVRDLTATSSVSTRLSRRRVERARWTTIGGTLDLVVPSGRAHLDDTDAIDVRAGHAGLLTSRSAGGQVCMALLRAEDDRAAVSH